MTAPPTLDPWQGRQATLVFLAFAFAYFLSALLRAVTATLAPEFSRELNLGAGQLGLLAGAYFLGFAALQLPLGQALDRVGPRRVLLSLLTVAIVGCLAFAVATSLVQLLLARFVIGIGVSACLMAPLTLFRHRFSVTAGLRANSWMLMSGSVGMVASTVPTRWLLPLLGWRGLFVVVAVLLALALGLIALAVPRDSPPATSQPQVAGSGIGYWGLLRSRAFVRMVPLGFFSYGGLVAMQSLWIGPWLTQVGGRSPEGAATALFYVNGGMLVAFLMWGLAMPRLNRAGWHADRLITVGWPLSAVIMGWIIWHGDRAGATEWALWCMSTSVVTLSQPMVAQSFPASAAGRALSAFNLVVFLGVFGVQWGVGLLIDGLREAGWSMSPTFRAALFLYLAASLAAYGVALIVRSPGRPGAVAQ